MITWTEKHSLVHSPWNPLYFPLFCLPVVGIERAVRGGRGSPDWLRAGCSADPSGAPSDDPEDKKGKDE